MSSIEVAVAAPPAPVQPPLVPAALPKRRLPVPAIWIAVLALLVVVLIQWRSPPLGLDAPVAQFSAARAMVAVRQIAVHPHPAGSAAHADVRELLRQQLRALGMAPEVQSTFSVGQHRFTAGMAHNIVARLPGTRPGKALLLAAHYDSAPMSHGAADNGASVAAVLETVRALRASGRVQNDIVVLFSDGEEIDSLGARAFVASHPWARDVALALNFEYRGSSGSMLLFETSTGNGRLMSGMAALSRPAGNSLMYEVYKYLGHPTDMAAFLEGGMAGMNFAAIEGAHRYHSEVDRADELDQRTLQQQGDAMLELVRHFGNADLAALRDGDAVYFDILERMLVSYPLAWAMPLAVLVLLALAIVLAVDLRCGAVRAARILLAAPALALALGAVGALAPLAWQASGLLQPDRDLMRFLTGMHWQLAGMALVLAGAFVLALRALARWFTGRELACGATLLWGVLLLAVTVLAPGASFILAWPLAAAVLALALQSFVPVHRQAVRAAVQCAGLAPALVLWIPLVMTLQAALPSAQMAYCAVPVLLVLALCADVLAGLLRGVAATLVVLGGAAIVLGAVDGRFGPSQPRPVHLNYVQQAGETGAVWMSYDARLDPSVAPLFGALPAQSRLDDLYPYSQRLAWVAAAPDQRLAVPAVEVLESAADGDGRKIRLRVQSQRPAQHISVELIGDTVIRSSVNGQPFSDDSRAQWRLDAYAMGTAPFEVTLRTLRHDPVRLHVTDASYGLPPALVGQRPSGVMSRPTGHSDRMLTVQVLPLP